MSVTAFSYSSHEPPNRLRLHAGNKNAPNPNLRTVLNPYNLHNLNGSVIPCNLNLYNLISYKCVNRRGAIPFVRAPPDRPAWTEFRENWIDYWSAASQNCNRSPSDPSRTLDVIQYKRQALPPDVSTTAIIYYSSVHVHVSIPANLYPLKRHHYANHSILTREPSFPPYFSLSLRNIVQLDVFRHYISYLYPRSLHNISIAMNCASTMHH